MATTIAKEEILLAYEDVRNDTTETKWSVFKFSANKIVHDSSGIDFEEFKSKFKDDERAFAFLRVQAGDEMSKRSKFILVTWIGSDVSPLKRAKMSTDKALIKEIISYYSVELQLTEQDEVNENFFLQEILKAGGANYGTGVRE